MSRTFSLREVQEIDRQTGRDIWIHLVRISTADALVVLRLTTDSEQTVSNGETFLSRFFDVILQQQDPDEPPEAQITMDAVDRSIELALDGLDDRPIVDILTVLSSDPDTVVHRQEKLRLVSYSLTLPTVTARLMGPDFFDQQSPGPNMDALETPGLFT